MVGQLPPTVSSAVGTERLTAYTTAGLPVTLTTEQIAALSGASAPYLLQWAVWFNNTPLASELLALYVTPVSYQYPAGFTNSVSAAPLTLPTAEFVLNVDRQVGGAGAWSTIGTITIGTDGSVTFATAGGAAISITVGDRLRVVGPSTPDATIAGFAATLKGTPAA